MKNGIMIAGTALVDKINSINKYPSSGELTKIISVSRSTGGNVPNVGIDLKKIDGDLPVFASTRVGNDSDGDFIIETLKENGLNVDFINRSKSSSTSFTDVMSVVGGQRTFFTYAGACAEYGLDDLDFNSVKVDMLHLGYFLLLDRVDAGDGEKILKKAKESGIKTSIDLVSENSDRYSLIIPCLKWTDNLIINESEAGKITGICPERKNLREIATRLKEMGVKERVIIHMPELGVCLSDNGYTEIPSLMLPKDFVLGTTGAGDAFCAGALYGIFKNFTDNEILNFASSVAALSLRTENATDGIVSFKEIQLLTKNFKRHEL